MHKHRAEPAWCRHPDSLILSCFFWQGDRMQILISVLGDEENKTKKDLAGHTILCPHLWEFWDSPRQPLTYIGGLWRRVCVFGGVWGQVCVCVCGKWVRLKGRQPLSPLSLSFLCSADRWLTAWHTCQSLVSLVLTDTDISLSLSLLLSSLPDLCLLLLSKETKWTSMY